MSNNINKIKAWLSTNKVCFVTNSTTLPSSLLLPSLKNYIEYIPILNFWIIPGIKNNEPFYGVQAFLTMLDYMLSNKRFNYVIYIDEDCFINDFELLIDEFKLFIDSNCCIAGPQDGGVFCHRNHSKLMINTFLSFWNISLLRDKKITFKDITSYVTDNIKNNQNTLFSKFLSELKNNKDLYSFMTSSSDLTISKVKQYRIEHFDNDGNSPYCEVVKNDPNNPIEPHQIPYSFDDEKEQTNFEPYYILEQALVLLSKTPIYYLFGTDLYDKEYVKEKVTYDISGITSAIYTNTDNKLIAIHTWFSRAYTKWPSTQLQLDHTKRINTIIKEFSEI